jgi:hypothetical protein
VAEAAVGGGLVTLVELLVQAGLAVEVTLVHMQHQLVITAQTVWVAEEAVQLTTVMLLAEMAAMESLSSE